MKPDLILLHAPSVYDFRKKSIMFGPMSDLVPSTPIFEMYPIGFLTMANYLTRRGFSVRIINLAYRMYNEPDFDAEGVKTFSPALERATMISMMARNPDVLALLTTASEERAAKEISVRSREAAGKKLRELKLPGDLLVLAIRRNEQLLIPHGNTAFEIGDRVSILGGHDSIMQAEKLFEG